MQHKLPGRAIPKVALSRDEAQAVADEALAMVRDTIAAYDAFVASDRAFPKDTWRHVKSKEGFNVYRSRKGSVASARKEKGADKDGRHGVAPPFQQHQHQPPRPPRRLSTRPSSSSSASSGADMSSRGYGGDLGLDREHTASNASMSSMTSKTTTASAFPILSDAVVSQAHLMTEQGEYPMVMLTGLIPGTVEDAGYGTLADTEAIWRLRSTYLNDSQRDCKILATLERPSEEDPFRFLGIKWAWRKLPAWVQQRDMVYAESTGMLEDDENGRTGYNLMHSIELPGMPELTEYGFLRMKCSLCYIVRPYDEKRVEIYCRAFLLPAGDVPVNLAALIYAGALLATVNIIDCSTMKKLMWLMRQRRKLSVQVNPRPDLDAATHCQGCARGLKRFGGLSRSSAVICRCCKRVVCGKCTSERKVVLDVADDGEVTQKPLPFCVHCVLEARALPSEEIALLTAVDWQET